MLQSLVRRRLWRWSYSREGDKLRPGTAPIIVGAADATVRVQR